MLHVLACVTQEHDLRFVVLAGLVCLFGCFAAFSLVDRARGTSFLLGRWAWLAAAAVVTGSGVWTTHFIAMLAYRPGLPVGYELGLTVLSVAVAIALSGVGYALSLCSPRWAVAGGAIAGAGIAAMHYIGMAALKVAARVDYDAVTVAASLVIGIALGACAFYLAWRRSDTRGSVQAALVFAGAICAMHFTGMSSVTLIPDPTIPLPDELFDPAALSIALAAVTLMMIALSLAGLMMDLHLGVRQAAEAERLRQHVQALQATQRELETTAADLSIALEQAAASNRAKSQFLAAMSHELRTPLNAVIGFSDMLSAEPYGPLGDQRYREYAGAISASGARLLKTINDVLEFADIDAGGLVLAEEEIDTVDLLESALFASRSAAEAAQLDLRREWAETLPHLVGDARRLRQVLINLLSNATKFTPAPGAVTVRAERCEAGFAISIADTGIGIAPEDIAGALQPFHQIDNRLTRAYEGTGLGLPLCKRLVELHGGRLILDSTPGVGTIVTVLLPAERLVELAPPALSSPEQPLGDLHRVKGGPLQELVAGDEHRQGTAGRVTEITAEAAD